MLFVVSAPSLLVRDELILLAASTSSSALDVSVGSVIVVVVPSAGVRGGSLLYRPKSDGGLPVNMCALAARTSREKFSSISEICFGEPIPSLCSSSGTLSWIMPRELTMMMCNVHFQLSALLLISSISDEYLCCFLMYLSSTVYELCETVPYGQPISTRYTLFLSLSITVRSGLRFLLCSDSEASSGSPIIDSLNCLLS